MSLIIPALQIQAPTMQVVEVEAVVVEAILMAEAVVVEVTLIAEAVVVEVTLTYHL
jgi:hypothetical protein